MGRTLGVAIVAFLAGLTVGLGYLAVQRATPIPERPLAQPITPPPEPAAAPLVLRLASSFSAAVPQLGTFGVATAEKMARLSAGQFELKFHEPGALAASAAVFDAVSAGEVEAGWTVATYDIENNSAFAFFAGLPFGARPSEYLAWLRQGGGEDLMRELYGSYGIMPLVCGFLPAEGGGWFRKEIQSPADLAGLKFRVSGMGARVLTKLGVETVALPGGEIYNALQSGAIDGAEFSTLANDLRFGFYKLAPHLYLPGWQQQLTPIMLVVNQKIWDDLSEPRRAMLTTICGDNIQDSLAEGESQASEALQTLRNKGVQIRQWPPILLAAFDKAWRATVAEESAANPAFLKIWESYSAFRANYAAWRREGYMR